MDPDQMAKRCPGSVALGAARLPRHRLTFTYDSGVWGGGVGHIEHAESHEVWGVLWEITPEDERSLDRYEGVAHGLYVKDIVEVAFGAESVRALTYRCTSVGYKRPSGRYIDALVRGARAFSLPEHYIESLRSVTS